MGCPITVEGNIGLIVRSTSLGALEVFFAVFLGALALLLCDIALTGIGKNIGFEWLQKIGDGDILVLRMGGVIRENRKVVQTGKDSVNFYCCSWFLTFDRPFLKRL